MDRSWEFINRSQTHKCGIGNEAAQFPGKEYINGIFLAVEERPRRMEMDEFIGPLYECDLECIY